jgi:phosphotriesterase-related protein
MSQDSGRIITVDGPIEPDEVGVTLPHEHVFVNTADAWYQPPSSAPERRMAEEPLSIEHLGFVNRNLYSHRDNMRLDSVETQVEEVTRFLRAGGSTIVDLTPKNIGRDPERVRGVARETGLQFVHGTGYYTRSVHPDYLDDMSDDEIEAEFVSDVREGIGDTDVRAGIVGELGVSERVHDAEERVVRAGARAARRTGVALNIHTPGRTPYSQRDRTYPPSRWALELLDVVEEEGLPPERVVMSHLDRTIYEDLSYQKELADRGAYVEYDLWGLEAYLEEYNDGLPSDIRRMEWATELIADGYHDRLLLSHDTWSKMQLRTYGGYGYAHVVENVVPMLEANGVSDEQIEEILIENPKRVLTVVDPEE